jgi:alkanesulfonate monooxygenase SsuD/methylene tetrahydromethanopterin reductase-like flavin-dependent oxidoreductase (luciferase family)
VRSFAKVGGGQVEYGVHLPLISLKGQRHWSLRGLLEYTEIADRLGFRAISANDHPNDHLIFPRPWLDGPTALAAVLASTGQMALATTVALPIVRGPVALAKSLAAIDLLSDGRLVVGVGPGSSAPDYAAVGIPFEERWKRLEAAVWAMRALWLREGSPFKGEFYSTEGVLLEPYPHNSLALLFGSVAGARKLVSGGRPAWATAGWLLPTTPPRKRSPTPGDDSQNTYTPQARILTDSPMQ